jgi:bacterioferritin-associated ferredoxin
MLVCHCYGVSEKRIRELVRQGARSGRDVARACGAGSGCGGCRLLVREILDAELEGEAASLPQLELSPAR